MGTIYAGPHSPIQRVSEAIASGVEANVSIVASGLQRIAGTGYFTQTVGMKIPESFLLAKAMRLKKTIVVPSPGRDRWCLDCSTRHSCRETVAMVVPIMLDTVAVGAIAIVGDSERQRARLLENETGFLAFMREMGNIVALQMPAHEPTFQPNRERHVSFDDILGEADPMVDAKSKAMKAAQTNASILLQGESGTGKEMFARAIHGASKRSSGPFVAVNCAAIPEPLFESELFGYEDGAFTGARKGGKPGILELANGGTLFLDEIGDLPLTLQGKLLRVIENNELLRVGGRVPVRLNVRLISATHKNLEELVLGGSFREDLFYRINVITISLPPLRDRPQDIPMLINQFLLRHSRGQGLASSIAGDVLDILSDYPWPGNVRELDNLIEYLVTMASGPVITLSDLPPKYRVRVHRINKGSVIPLRELERTAILNALRVYGASGRGKRLAAKALGIDISTLYRKLKQYSMISE